MNNRQRKVQRPGRSTHWGKIVLAIIGIEVILTIEQIYFPLPYQYAWIDFALLFSPLFTGLVAVMVLGLVSARRKPDTRELLSAYKAEEGGVRALLEGDFEGIEATSSGALQPTTLLKGVRVEARAFGSTREIRIDSDKPLDVRSITEGVGQMYPVQGSRSDWVGFSLLEQSPAEWSPSGGKTQSILFTIKRTFPSEGFLPTKKSGLINTYFVAPAAKIEVANHRDFILMLFEPPTRRYNLNPSQASLTVERGESKFIASLSGGNELRGDLIAQGGGFEWARLFLIRSMPGLEEYGKNRRAVLSNSEVLAEINGPGRSDFRWAPTNPPFPATVLLTDSTPGIGTAAYLSQKVFPGRAILGDGRGVKYHLRLTVHFGVMREENSDADLFLL